jgi:hypothetical protein
LRGRGTYGEEGVVIAGAGTDVGGIHENRVVNGVEEPGAVRLMIVAIGQTPFVA